MSDWIRVTRQDRCPICDGDSWCTYNDDVAICMRISSTWEKTFRDGSTGWIHKLRERIPNYQVKKVYKPKEVPINAKMIWTEFHRQTRPYHIQQLANSLGVTQLSLCGLSCVWSEQHKAYAFPMFDGDCNIVGIRLRSMDGRKWAVKGSRQGIFVNPLACERRVYICEGPTDTAAAITMGLYAIGRPHCSGGMEDIIKLCHKQRVREAIIISDNDGPGLRGAITLRDHLPVDAGILVLPCKDIRKFLNTGGAKADLEELVNNINLTIK